MDGSETRVPPVCLTVSMKTLQFVCDYSLGHAVDVESKVQ